MDMPNNIDNEKALLGAIINAQDKTIAVNTASEIIEPADFYRQANKIIYEVILKLHNEHKGIDNITLTNCLIEQKRLEAVGGIAYVTSLVNCAPSSAIQNLKTYADTIKKTSIARQLIHATDNIKAEAGQYENIHETLDTAQKEIFNIAAKNTKKDDCITPEVFAMDTMEAMDKELNRKEGEILGLDTGFKELNKLTDGLQKSDLIIIGARPAMGKTSFALSLAANLIQKNIPVGFITIEMSHTQLGKRMAYIMGTVDANKTRNGTLDNKEVGRLVNAIDKMSRLPMYIVDNSSLNVEQIRAKARKLKHEHDIQVLMIDYLQLINSTGKKENRNLDVGDMTRKLKELARELDITVIALAQLSRKLEDRQVKEPTLSDLRDSGSIEQDADIVGLLYREEYYNPETDKKNVLELNIAKHRNGATGKINLMFYKSLFKVHDPIK